jgi:hypothetical protein
VMVAAPVAHEVSGASAGDHGTGRHQLVEQSRSGGLSPF